MMLVCGLDEVGRGALAGPLVAVASLFRTPYPEETLRRWEADFRPISSIKDSKQLKSHALRKKVFQSILCHHDLVDFGIGEVSVEEINQYGIDRANETAFRRAVQDLREPPGYVLIDGDHPLMGWDMKLQRHRPKGDSFWWPVSAASILAKVIRDSYMMELDREYPYYDWAKNVGYGTANHTRALQEVGASPHHRTQFIKNVGRPHER